MAATSEGDLPALVPVNRPLSLIPVGLKEAALDSPSFRASTVHFSDQLDAVEKWLDGLVRTATKLSQEATALEAALNAFSGHCKSLNNLSEAVLDHDYTFLALRRLGEGGAQAFWSRTIMSMRNTQNAVVEPIKQFLASELRPFKETRRHFERSQKEYDGVLLRYAGQSKTKEASSLREDAFHVHESRRAYLKASMDFSVLGPQLRLALDSLLIKISCDHYFELDAVQQSTAGALDKHAIEMCRIRSWSKNMLSGEKALKRELLLARRQIEDSAEQSARPSRELEEYSLSTVPYLGSGPPASRTGAGGQPAASSKQGWLFLRTMTGKPARAHWVRRWFFVKSGIFGCLVHGARSGGVEESEKIGVLLCGVRPAFQEERRFCFQVTTKDTTILLQTETQADLIEWINVFEVAKQKAIEEPGTTELLASSGNPSSDAAFAVSPAVAPELAAKRADGQIMTVTEDPNAILLSVDGDTANHEGSRKSVDVSTLRKQVSDADSERSRDHAARILQKLDISRKSNALPQLNSSGAVSMASAGGGISSLIAASHSALPVGPGRPLASSTSEAQAKAAEGSFTNTMAPSTLVAPPAQTNLSKTAVKVGVDQGVDLGKVDNTGGVPSGLMANQWGSANYGHISRLERGEVDQRPSMPPSPMNSGISTRRVSDPTDSTEHDTSLVSASSTMASSANTSQSPADTPISLHRKTISMETRPRQRTNSAFKEFPQSYPAPLRAHDAQFRMLFPNVAQDERVVLVFRASWNPSDSQDLPGRVFATPKEIYFYSHHFGMVLVSGNKLDTISEVSFETAASNDFLYLQLRGPAGNEGTITLKTFLESPKLLRSRLDYLVSNCASEEPDDLETILQTLVKIETEVDSDDHDQGYRQNGLTQSSHRPKQDHRTRLKVDRGLYQGDDPSSLIDSTEMTRFKLPSQPVSYTPLGVTTLAAERVFGVSAKALLHIVFGDKAAIIPTTYQERGAEAITQSPWVKVDEEGHFRRQFGYTVNGKDVIDTQTIDVANDHLVYMVTDTRVPWHLPLARDFNLVSKFVITHEAKSKCKLTVFTKVDWTRKPWFSKGMLERRALDDLQLDSLNMMDLIGDQVQRLGPGAATRMAIDVFGFIGRHSEAAQISAKDLSSLSRPLRTAVRRRTLFGLILENLLSLAASAASTLVMSFIGLARIFATAINLHRLLALLLLLSVCFSMWNTSDYAAAWWHDRRAADFMSRIGVIPSTSISKAIYLKDFSEALTDRPGELDYFNSTSQCSRTFANLLNAASLHSTSNPQAPPMASTSSRETKGMTRRLQRTRLRLATYRHDLLVALRLVNSVERETIRAEYENWLLDEHTMCLGLGDMLDSLADAQKNKTETSIGSVTDNKDTDELRKWYGDYCRSCELEVHYLERKVI